METKEESPATKPPFEATWRLWVEDGKLKSGWIVSREPDPLEEQLWLANLVTQSTFIAATVKGREVAARQVEAMERGNGSIERPKLLVMPGGQNGQANVG